MTKKNTILQFVYMFAPVIVFRVLYGYFGLVAAMIFSLFLNIVMMAYNYKKKGRIGNSLLIGLFGIVLSFIGYTISANENAYFLSSIVQSSIFVVWILAFMIKKKCYVFLFLKDFNVPYLDEIDEKEFLSMNYPWLFLFCLRLFIRIFILFAADLSFETLYWINFLSGDPLSLPMIYYTFRYLDKKIRVYYDETYKTAS